MPEPTLVKIHRNLRLFPFWVALVIGVELLWSERVWMTLVVALAGIWLIEFLWARALARGLRFRRELRYGWAQVGDELEERFTLSNASPIPALWVQVVDHSSLFDHTPTLATGLEGRSENSWRTRHACARRGVFHLGPTAVMTGTPFGLYTVEFHYAASDSLIVMPPVVPLPEIAIAPGGRAYEGRRRASTFERTVSAVGVRQYVPGDPFKAIHWRTVAHTDELMVRTFESTPAGDWWIWLDLDQKTQAGAGENSTLEHAIILAASLAVRGLGDGRAVGLIANAREPVWLAPQSGEFQRLHILRTLATLEPGLQPLSEQLMALRPTVDRNASLILITPAPEGEWLSALLSFQSRMTGQTVILLDRASYDGTHEEKGDTALLAQWGIPHVVITRDVMDRPEARPGRQGTWEWRVSATGRAVARTAPSDPGWRTLA